MDNNEKRAEKILRRFGFDFRQEYRNEIRKLLIEEINNYQDGSSEYLRVLCGYLFCIGNTSDMELLKKVKYNISFDVGCMIDMEWIENMDSADNAIISKRNELISEFMEYYSQGELKAWKSASQKVANLRI